MLHDNGAAASIRDDIVVYIQTHYEKLTSIIKHKQIHADKKSNIQNNIYVFDFP